MKKMKLGSLITGLVGLAALLVVASSPAQAAFVVGGENGWQMSFDGMINAFMVYDTTNNRQLDNGTVVNGGSGFLNGGIRGAEQGYSIRTGLLPSIFAFNVKSPTINGVDYGARVGLYPQIQNNGSRTGFGPDTIANGGLGNATGSGGGSRIDIREVFFTADGCFGQFLIGRALNLYEGKNILTDMTLIGVGVPATVSSGAGTTLGNIGYGYSFPSFGSQFRYTTPDINGLKWAFSLNDPSQITAADGTAADVTNQPAFMTELSYAKAMGNIKLNTWLSGLYQEAKYKSDSHKVSTIGGAGGAQVTFGPLEALISGYGGQAVGILFTQDDPTGSLDNAHKERITYGGLAHVSYTLGKAKIGVQYGINYADRTDNDKIVSAASLIKSQQAVTGGVYYSLNKYLTLVGEYTFARSSWYDSSRQDSNIGSLGTVFVW
jgi:hypothetical protein